mgnify:CR=1 FL=1
MVVVIMEARSCSMGRVCMRSSQQQVRYFISSSRCKCTNSSSRTNSSNSSSSNSSNSSSNRRTMGRGGCRLGRGGYE